MGRLLLFLLTAGVAAAGDDSWDKVVKIEPGSEIRILRSGEKRAVTARLDEVRPDAVVIIMADRQLAVRKEHIERLDVRPASASRLKMEARREVGTRESAVTGRGNDTRLPARSTSGTVSIRSRRDFETVYRRASAAPAK